jgi:Ca2+/H+ antiporter
MAGAAVIVTAVVWDGHSSRKEGVLLVAAYAAAVLGFLFGGGR